jgi:hypothetical protein
VVQHGCQVDNRGVFINPPIPLLPENVSRHAEAWSGLCSIVGSINNWS